MGRCRAGAGQAHLLSVLPQMPGAWGMGTQCVTGTEFQFREVKTWEIMVAMAVHRCECTWCHWTEQLNTV